MKARRDPMLALVLDESQFAPANETPALELALLKERDTTRADELEQ